jgi:hypothetical protein
MAQGSNHWGHLDSLLKMLKLWVLE